MKKAFFRDPLRHHSDLACVASFLGTLLLLLLREGKAPRGFPVNLRAEHLFEARLFLLQEIRHFIALRQHIIREVWVLTKVELDGEPRHVFIVVALDVPEVGQGFRVVLFQQLSDGHDVSHGAEPELLNTLRVLVLALLGLIQPDTGGVDAHIFGRDFQLAGHHLGALVVDRMEQVPVLLLQCAAFGLILLHEFLAVLVKRFELCEANELLFRQSHHLPVLVIFVVFLRTVGGILLLLLLFCLAPISPTSSPAPTAPTAWLAG
mmetsp:Transcript_19398/g.56531  ORF Transcript_19398/g.56531 Transcript_19398/m.56531 type:complete len:263 (-) Transcript_19398:180-968(-)